MINIVFKSMCMIKYFKSNLKNHYKPEKLSWVIMFSSHDPMDDATVSVIKVVLPPLVRPFRV